MPRSRRPLGGKTAIVTGGTRGVGRSLAQALAKRGVSIALCARDAVEVERAVRELGSDTMGRSLDVGDREAYAAFIDEVERELGPIDYLVNVAGIMPVGPFDQEPDATTTRILDVNLAAAVFSTKNVAGRMKARGTGHIVNVASGASWIAGGGGATYCASKFGLLGYCESVAYELRGTGVDISIVAPGVIDTDMTAGVKEIPGLRTVSPDEVAQAIVDVLERPRFATFVPKRVGFMALMLAATPFGLRHRLARATKTDTLMLNVDTDARARYESRAVPAEPRSAVRPGAEYAEAGDTGRVRTTNPTAGQPIQDRNRETLVGSFVGPNDRSRPRSSGSSGKRMSCQTTASSI